MKMGDKHFERKDIQTELKHLLLDNYLLNWGNVFANAAHGSSIKKCHFVDGFAGRGSFGDGKEGSPLIAANRLLALQNKFNTQYSHKELRFHLHMVELNPDYYIELNKQKDGFITGDFHIYNGKFEEYISKLLTATKGCPAFYFIDPFGYKGVNMSDMYKILQQPSHEILINVMSYSLVRNYSIQNNEASLCKFFNLSSLPDDIHKYVEEAHFVQTNPIYKSDSFSTLEENIIKLYKYQLKQGINGTLYTLSKRIHSQINPNVYFHMVFATTKRDGLVEMKKAMVDYEKARENYENIYLEQNNHNGFALYDSLFSDSLTTRIYGYKEFAQDLMDKFNKMPISYGELIDYFLQHSPLPFKDDDKHKSIADFTSNLAVTPFLKSSNKAFRNYKQSDEMKLSVNLNQNFIDQLNKLPEEPPEQLSLF